MIADREKMMQVLGELFPITGTTEDFDGSEGGIWICGECGYLNKKGIPYFDYYDMSSLYTFGVENKLYRLAERHGWYFDWYDGGTIMVYPD